MMLCVVNKFCLQAGGARRQSSVFRENCMKTVAAVSCLASFTFALGVLLALAGCATSSSTAEKPERGPNGTIAYMVQIETSEPGARIEANGDYVGKSPTTLKIFGDKDGTFHNFGSYEFIIKAYPVRQGQYLQTKVFRTGGWFTAEDRIPTRLYFDLDLQPTTTTQKIDVNVNSK